MWILLKTLGIISIQSFSAVRLKSEFELKSANGASDRNVLAELEFSYQIFCVIDIECVRSFMKSTFTISIPKMYGTALKSENGMQCSYERLVWLADCAVVYGKKTFHCSEMNSHSIVIVCSGCVVSANQWNHIAARSMGTGQRTDRKSLLYIRCNTQFNKQYW